MIGKMLGPYRSLDKSGQGGMGETIPAEDNSLHRKFFLKFFIRDMLRDAITHSALSNPAVDHPCICHINEVADCEYQSCC